MFDVVRRALSCMNKPTEEGQKNSSTSKRTSGPRHIRKRQPVKPNAYVKDTSFTSQSNENNNNLGRTITTCLERQDSILDIEGRSAALTIRSRPSSMGKEDGLSFDNLSMPAFNRHSFNFTDISAKSSSSLTASRSDILRQATPYGSKEDNSLPNREEAINVMLSCNPAQRYSGPTPLIPTPKIRNKKLSNQSSDAKEHSYNNTKYPHKNTIQESPENENAWGWVSVGNSKSQPKKQKLNNNKQKNEPEQKTVADAKDNDENVVETFVSPGGISVSIKSTTEDQLTFKTEYWRHLVALLGGGNVTFSVVQKKPDFLTSWKSMQLLKEDRKMNSNAQVEAKTEDEESQFKLTRRAYQKLINYCHANHMTLHEELPAFCKNRARKSSRAVQHESDFKRLSRVLETVEECAWYWGNLSGNEARRVLNNSSPGTFLLRDSSDPRYLYSLSIKTTQGPTSIRIVYKDNSFQFDSDMDQRSSSCRNREEAASKLSPDHPNYVAKRKAPVFDCVVSMVLRYTKHITTTRPHNPKPNTNSTPEQFMCYWMNRAGRQEIPVVLAKPKNKGILSLQDHCRISLSKELELWKKKDTIESLPLPNVMKKYIKMYPYPA